MSNQPKWTKIGVVGDINPVDYGGGIVYSDKTGHYAPEVEYFERDSDNDNSPIRVYRFSADKCTFVNGVLSDNKYHPERGVWFNYTSIGAQFGDKAGFIAALCSDDENRRAWAWTKVGLYHGFENLDGYPLVMTQDEAERRVKTARK